MKRLFIQARQLTDQHKKLIAALAGVAVAVFGDRFGVGADALTLAVVTIATYIFGSAVEDGLRSRD